MSSNNEYTGSIAQGMKTYATLGCYYGAGSTMPALKANQVNQVQVVPMWGGISYDALQHGVECNGKYFNITNAYGAGASTCSTSYAQRLCSGCNDKPGQGMGWRCHPGKPGGKGKCLKDGHLGAQGVFKSAYQCQENCKSVV